MTSPSTEELVKELTEVYFSNKGDWRMGLEQIAHYIRSKLEARTRECSEAARKPFCILSDLKCKKCSCGHIPEEILQDKVGDFILEAFGLDQHEKKEGE